MVAMEAITMEMCRIEERVVCSSSLSSLSSTASHHRFAALLVLLAGREEGQEMVLRVRGSSWCWMQQNGQAGHRQGRW
jgi:hypothetical protein